MHYLTIDSGTTNTRAVLWTTNREILGTHKINTGVRNTVLDGHNNRIKSAVKECIDTLIQKNNINIKKCEIIAAGMITSKLGLWKIPHLVAPAGKKEFAAAMQSKVIEDVCSEPIWFIPGLKNHGDVVNPDELSRMDMLRGEETESIAILEKLALDGDCVFILPGSHTKCVAVNKRGQLTGCLTTLSGELLECITNHTILADAVDKKFVSPEEYNKIFILKGFRDSIESGMARALFQVRIISQFTGCPGSDAANYLMGVVLGEDVKAIEKNPLLNLSKNKRIIITGKEPLTTALSDLLTEAGYTNAAVFSLPDIQELSGAGAVEIAQVRR